MSKQEFLIKVKGQDQWLRAVFEKQAGENAIEKPGILHDVKLLEACKIQTLLYDAMNRSTPFMAVLIQKIGESLRTHPRAEQLSALHKIGNAQNKEKAVAEAAVKLMDSQTLEAVLMDNWALVSNRTEKQGFAHIINGGRAIFIRRDAVLS